MFILQDLFGMIRETDIDLSLWGINGNKTATHLIDEVNTGYSTVNCENNTLTRHIAITAISVYFKPHPDELLILREEGHSFKDGKILRSNILKPYSIIKQLHQDEIPCKKAFEAIADEELRIPIQPFQIIARRKLQVANPRDDYSNPYPGITTQMTIHRFECYLDINQFDSRGYTNIQSPLRVSHFHWISHIPSEPV